MRTDKNAPVTVAAPALSDGRPLRDSPVDRLRPRTAGQLLDGGFEVMRYRFATSIALAATAGLPLIAAPTLLNVARRAGISEAIDSVGSTSNPVNLTSGFGFSLTVILGSALATAIVGVWQTRMVVGWLHGEDPSIGTVLRSTKGRLWVLLLAWLCLLPLRAIGGIFTCGILAIFLNPLLLVVSPVIAVEGLGPMASIARGWRVARRRYAASLGLFVMLMVVTLLLSYGVLALRSLATALIPDDVAGDVVSSAIAIGLQLIMLSVNASVATLLYLDARVRNEGLDLELDAVTYFEAVP